MHHLATGLQHQLAHFGDEAEKAYRVARNNAAYESAVRQTWADNPDAAEYVLAHTNSIFFAKDEAPSKGASKDADRFVMGVYLDDPMARSELNARREVLMLFLMNEGLRFDELRIIPSTMGMRDRHLFPLAVERMGVLFGGKAPEPPLWEPSALTPEDVDRVCSQVQDEALAASLRSAMQAYADSPRANEASKRAAIKQGEAAQSEEEAAFRRAVCLALGDIDQAEALLSLISASSFELVRNPQSTTPPQFRRHWCTLFVASPEMFSRMIKPHETAITARSRELGLYLAGIRIAQARL